MTHEAVLARPAVGTTVTLGNTETNEESIWTVAAHEGDDTVVLTRYGMAPWTSMDRIMGNGPCPTYGTYTKRATLNADGTCETTAATFEASR
jgi:hypothetical protein